MTDCINESVPNEDEEAPGIAESTPSGSKNRSKRWTVRLLAPTRPTFHPSVYPRRAGPTAHASPGHAARQPIALAARRSCVVRVDRTVIPGTDTTSSVAPTLRCAGYTGIACARTNLYAVGEGAERTSDVGG
jgi:hypothetical protein